MSREPLRDVPASAFADILSRLGDRRLGVEAAVFYDAEGETVDYFSFLDPFRTRLVAAHHGLIFSSVDHRLRWLGGGAVTTLEIATTRFETVTIPLGEGYFVTVMVSAGKNDDDLHVALRGVLTDLRAETGI